MPQIFIMLIGFSLSGKSTLAKKILKKFPDKFIKIDTNAIHDFLNKTYSAFQDDNTIQGKSFELRQKTTKAIQNILLEILSKENRSIILDSCNLSKEKRERILSKVKKINKKIRIIIVQIDIPQKLLYRRLKKADNEMIQKGEKPIWIDLYEKIQKNKFDAPKEDEADLFLKSDNSKLLAIIRDKIRD